MDIGTIFHPFVGNITPIEAILIGIAALALSGHLYALYDAKQDEFALKRTKRNGILLFTARGNIALSGFLAFVQLCDLSLWIFSATQAQPPQQEIGIIQLLAALNIIVSRLTLLGVSFGTIWFRHRLRSMRD